MSKNKRIRQNKKQHIQEILPTNDKLTGRAGLSLFALYLRNIQLFPIVDRMFGSMRKNSKGLPITELFVQMLSFFMDGTSRHLVWFDQLKADESYSAVLGSERLASSHTMKRFFGAFSFRRVYLFRKLLQDLFIWRLNQTKPKVIVPGLDTTVFDNNDAEKRHGVEPTDKKVKGFQPLQLNLGPLCGRRGVPWRQEALQSWRYGRKDAAAYGQENPDSIPERCSHHCAYGRRVLR